MGYRTDDQVTTFKAEIKKRVLRHLGDEAKTGLTDFIDDYMKDALRAIARAHTWTWRRLAPRELLAAAPASETAKTDVPTYVDQYAEFMLYQEVDKDSLPLTYIPPAEWVRRDCQKLTALATIFAFTVMDDDFYYSPPVAKTTGKAVMLWAHIAPSQLDDDTTPDPDVYGIWKRVPDSFYYCLEVGTLAEMDLLEENIAHKWVEKHTKELERLIGLDETSSAEGGK